MNTNIESSTMKLGDENRFKVRGESDSEERPVATLAQAIYSGQFDTVMQTLVQNPDQLIMPEFTSDNKYRDYAFLYHYDYPFIALIKCVLEQRNSKSKEHWNLFKFLVDTFPDTILKCFSGPNHLIVRIMYMSQTNQTTLEAMITLLATIPGFSQVLNTLDSEGELALYVAMYNENIAPSIVSLMIKNGANPVLLDKHERNAFHFIAQRDKVFQTNIFPVLYQLFNQSTNINQLSRAGGTPLHTLLRKNIYVAWCSLKTLCSFTKAKLESGVIPCDHDLVKKLLEMGADPNILYHGVTVLHIACMAGDSELVKLLLSFKADVNMLSSLGLTAIDYLPDTTDKNKLRVQESRELLISAGAKELEETDEFPDDRRLDAAVKLISHEKAKGRFCYLSEQAQRKFKEASQGIKSTFEERTIKTFNIQPDKCTEVVKHHQVDHFVLTELFDEKEARVTVMKDIVPEKKRNLHVLKRPLSSFIHRKRIGWEFLQREMRPESLDRYLSQFNTVQLTIAGDTPLDFVDLREVDDYSFVVNTVMSWPGRLSELLKGDPKFFTETPYISCCLLNKATRGFSGGHHTNLLFPIYMALEVKPGAIQYMGPTDIGSPYACPPESKFQYLNYVSKAREEMDILEALHQCDLMERTENKMDNRFPPSPFFAEASVRCHTAYRTSGYKDSG